MALDPTMLLQLAGALKGGGGSTKVSQTSNNTSNAILSFNTVSNIGGGVNSNPNAPITAPQTTTATAGTGTDDAGYTSSLPAYDYELDAGGEVSALAANPTDTSWMVWAGLGVVAVIGWFAMGK